MRRLKIFEEFKVGTLYTGSDEDSRTARSEVSGHPVDIIDRDDSGIGRPVWAVFMTGAKATSIEDICFLDLEDAKSHVASMSKRYEDSGVEVSSFLIKKLILAEEGYSDLVRSAEERSGQAGEDGTRQAPDGMDIDESIRFLERNFNVIIDAYVAIAPQKHRSKMNEASIRKAMEKLRREFNTRDSKRISEAISAFREFMSPMMADSERNMQAWKLGRNGKKYGEAFERFLRMIERQQ